MKITAITTLLITFLMLSCNSTTTEEQVTPITEEILPDFKNRGHEFVYQMVQKVGNWNTLQNKKDVQYTYSYLTPDGKEDVSHEKYLFDGELSYGNYVKHERTFPELEGEIEQGYGGQNFWLKHQGETITDSTRLARVAFNRPTNFYWFTMFQKLLDPSVLYEFKGEQNINDQDYNLVEITFATTNEKPTDTYILYINKKTQLVDQFLFTVADFGKIETPFLMQMEYEDIDGILLPTKRKYKPSTWEGTVTEEPWIYVNWTAVKFNNGISKSDFKQ